MFRRRSASNQLQTRSRLSDLFFFKSRPKLRDIPIDWERPKDEAAWQQLIDDANFVSIPQWKDDDLTQYPVVEQDVKDLEKYLLPIYFEIHQRSLYYQNRFNLVLWIFGWGAFLTISFAALASIFYVTDPQFEPGRAALQSYFSYMTAILGAVTLIITLTGNRNEIQKEWVRNRRYADDLRIQYFKYLAHVFPYDKEDRLQKLRDTMASMWQKQQGTTVDAEFNRSRTLSKRLPHNQLDIDLLWRIYSRKRLGVAHHFYRSQVNQTDVNADFTFGAIGILLVLMALAAVVAALLTDRFWTPMLTVLSAILPAMALLLEFFRQLYGWDLQRAIYQEALTGFEQLKFSASYAEGLDSDQLTRSLHELVSKSESIIANESSKWGLQAGLDTTYERVGILEVEPTFGPPSSDPQFECDIFMIMPFAAEFQPLYREHIVPLCRDLHIQIKRGDDFFSEHSIMQDIWGAIFSCKLVITECTGRNANVFYELGIAHTLGKPAIMITQKIEDTPFDLRHLRTIVYEPTSEGLQTLQAKLKEAIALLI